MILHDLFNTFGTGRFSHCNTFAASVRYILTWKLA